MKFYTGIGSRETPERYLKIMTDLSVCLERSGWTLRSGGSWGADEAFQKGVSDYSNIFLPNPNFRKGEGIKGVFINDIELTRTAMYTVSKYDLHENWDNLISSKGGLTALKLHTRNVFQILGDDLRTPSKFVVCYTRDGAIDLESINEHTGGTRTALRLACHFNVPIFNLALSEHELRITNWIDQMDKEFESSLLVSKEIKKKTIKNKY